MIGTLILLLPQPALPMAGPFHFQDPAPSPAPEAKPHVFPKISGSEKKQIDAWLLQLRTGKSDASVTEAQDGLRSFGAGAATAAIDYFRKVGPERLLQLRVVLDSVLVEADLDLGWKELDRKSPPEARSYLLRRWADSQRKDAAEFLKARLAEAEDDDSRYQAARGLVRRGDSTALATLRDSFRDRWKDDRSELRADLEGAPREALALATASLIRQSTDKKDELAAIRLFGLLGVPEATAVLRAPLDDPDGQVKLAAINACRAIFSGEPPLERPSAFRDIDLANQWKGRLK
ncbi:MAG TPA: hypothetical protein VGC54_05460 [Planctomycetota bacterium]